MSMKRRECTIMACATLLTVSAAGSGSPAPVDSQKGAPAATEAIKPGGVHDFDFLVGEWRVHHRYLRSTAQGTEWAETDGTCSHRKLIDGGANVEEHTINGPSGANRAIGLRSYDRQAGQWSIWWLDGRAPAGALDPPVQGRFENGVGTFYGDNTLDGKPIRVRFIWSGITPTSARWEQAYSHDGGKTWEPNWVMEFQRASTEPGQVGASFERSHDFDFLVGEWRVHHRRMKPGSGEWVEFDGTCGNRLLIGGAANLEEHALQSASGAAYHAVGLRAYDPQAKQCAIWWLDSRYPSGPLDPPVKGGFKDGVGTFYSDFLQDGKPARVRFLWSRITPTSARWEQALSLDAGKTWETNWVMEFRRV
jgi:hypothetical protein